MAFLSKDLSVLAYANGFTLWHYKTESALTEVGGAGYMNSVSDLVRAGDIIFVTARASSAPEASMMTVASNTNGSVALSTLL